MLGTTETSAAHAAAAALLGPRPPATEPSEQALEDAIEEAKKKLEDSIAADMAAADAEDESVEVEDEEPIEPTAEAEEPIEPEAEEPIEPTAAPAVSVIGTAPVRVVKAPEGMLKASAKARIDGYRRRNAPYVVNRKPPPL